MVRGELYIADYGPQFTGWIKKQTERMVCVATPRVQTDATARAAIRELVRVEAGVDCAECGGCLIAEAIAEAS